MTRVDFAVIGGGIVGLATALKLTRLAPGRPVAVFEKESALARHQTGRNSGVIHAGLYYKPGSAKAELCVRGARELFEFCRAHAIPHERCGKLVVATHESQRPALAELFRRAQANGLVGVREVSPEEAREIEPHCTAVRALHVPETGIVDYIAVATEMAGQITAAGGSVHTGARVAALRRDGNGWALSTAQGDFAANVLVNCGGLHADRLARSAGAPHALRIVPFRGEYYTLRPERAALVRNLIYPVPDPRFPFLGVHFTRRIGGGIECGPNAVLALKREGYARGDFSFADSAATFSYAGFWRLALRHWKTGLGEIHRSFSRAAFARALQALVPEVEASDLLPAASGVRAQALQPDGALVDDFRIVASGRALHVLNAPSPAATASLAIGETLAAQALALLPAPASVGGVAC
jgi:(S)-2-hydroxyglutarate dehydrogenase